MFMRGNYRKLCFSDKEGDKSLELLYGNDQ